MAAKNYAPLARINSFAVFTALVLFFLSYPVKAIDEQARLRQSLETFNLAFVKADTITLDKLLHPDYQHTNSGSKAFGKKAWLKWVKSRQPATQSGELTYQQYVTEDLNIQMFGDSAVVTGRNIASGVNNGEPFTVDIRFTHLWVKNSGHWQRAAFHDSKAK